MKPAEFASLNGQCAVVTGSSSGIGRAMALEFAAAGADVVLHCRQNLAAAEELRRQIVGLGRQAEIVAADLGRECELATFVDRVWSVWNRVDIWVNNAGADLLTGPESRLEYAKKLQTLLDVDVRATMLLSRLAGPRMRAAGGGVMLNIGWDQADRGMEGDSGELFAAAKNAIMGFSRALALSLAPEVRVNCIAPGWIRTAWGRQAAESWQQRVLRETPLRRWGEPEDVAATARFLASPAAAFITGQVIAVNGGAVR